MTSPYSALVLTPAHRDRAVQLLSAAFASDRLTIDQLDERLAAVYRVQSQAELEALLADPGDPSRSLAMEPANTRLAAPHTVPERAVIMAVLGGAERRGSWVVPRHLKITAILGGCTLDLREARLSPGITEVEIFSIWGGVEIVVPDGVRVEVTALALMGGVSVKGGDITDDPNAPVLRISGAVVMAGVELKKKDRSRQNERRYIQALERAEQIQRYTKQTQHDLPNPVPPAKPNPGWQGIPDKATPMPAPPYRHD